MSVAMYKTRAKHGVSAIVYKLKRVGRQIMPPTIIDLLKGVGGLSERVRGFYYAHKKFNHAAAQKFEFAFGIHWMMKADNFLKTYAWWERAKKEGIYSPAAYERISLQTSSLFFRDKSEFDDFCRKVDGRRCMEIGSATEGVLAMMPWLDGRIIIDPLIVKYRDSQRSEWGKTIFMDDIRLCDQIAETVIPDLVGKIDGCIVCTNTLDHTTDPWKILENIGRYAAEGCLLLFWSDIWLLRPADVGHRNITKDPAVLETKFKELGFDIVRKLPEFTDRPTIQYGCVAAKRATP